MNQQRIEQHIKLNHLRRRAVDKEKVKSIIESSIMTMSVVNTIPLVERSSILIFRETYESIRQLGDAKWWLLGYEPENHEVSMEILKEMEINEKTKLNHLNRFKRIRNDINYRGFKTTVDQAKEITDFWNVCSEEIILILNKELTSGN